MFIGKSQANIMGLLSALMRKLTGYSAILIIIIINSNSIQAMQPKHWLFVSDDNINTKVNVSERAQNRRAIRGFDSPLDKHDYRPDPEVIEQIENAGLTVHVVSRWLGAVSVAGSEQAINQVRQLGFIKDIKQVATFKNRTFDNEELTPQMAKTLSPLEYTALDYGPSYTQLHLCQIDSLHSLNFTGEGVYIGIMDTGFNLEHSAMSHIIDDGRLLATYDFINNDGDVQDSQDVQQSHGTATWSVIGGYSEGNLIGAAYNAEFFLAKTELYYPEVQIEEDYWIAAAESMEVAGVDIISSSVGYTDWYDQSDLDGDTPAITAAADMAASLGIIVVNSAGNERRNNWGTLIVPADGDSVIAAGGIISNGTLYANSSPGPTADGRIKPDVCALAQGVVTANYYSGGFLTSNGTSFSAPIIAGGLALILEAHPDWDIGAILYNLKRYASNSGSPDNDYGWGIARFYNMYSGEIASPDGEPVFVAPHPAHDSVIFLFDPPITENSKIIIYTVAGDKVKSIDLVPDGDSINEKIWDAKNKSAEKIASGFYLAYLHSPSACRTIKFAFVK